MRPEITEPFRKIRKALTLAEVDMDDEDIDTEAVEQQLQKIEEQVQELRRISQNA